MAKKIQGYIKLQIVGGKANPAPPIGPALGQQGLNIMEFCKRFNAETQNYIGEVLPTVITVFSDRSFTFITKSSPASILLKKAANVQSGSSRPSTEKVAKVSRKQIEEIARTKANDLNSASIDAAIRMIEGTARSMGIEVTSSEG